MVAGEGQSLALDSRQLFDPLWLIECRKKVQLWWKRKVFTGNVETEKTRLKNWKRKYREFYGKLKKIQNKNRQG